MRPASSRGKDGWLTGPIAGMNVHGHLHAAVTFEQVLTRDFRSPYRQPNMTLANLTAYLSRPSPGEPAAPITGSGMWNWFTPNPDAPRQLDRRCPYTGRFSDVDPCRQTKDYYQKMYNFTLTDEWCPHYLRPHRNLSLCPRLLFPSTRPPGWGPSL